jgi:hypothetical protein
METEYLLTTRHPEDGSPLAAMAMIHEPCQTMVILTERMHVDTVTRLIADHKDACPAVEGI